MTEQELKELLIAITLDITQKCGDADDFLQKLKSEMSNIGR